MYSDFLSMLKVFLIYTLLINVNGNDDNEIAFVGNIENMFTEENRKLINEFTAFPSYSPTNFVTVEPTNSGETTLQTIQPFVSILCDSNPKDKVKPKPPCKGKNKPDETSTFDPTGQPSSSPSLNVAALCDKVKPKPPCKGKNKPDEFSTFDPTGQPSSSPSLKVTTLCDSDHKIEKQGPCKPKSSVFYDIDNTYYQNSLPNINLSPNQDLESPEFPALSNPSKVKPIISSEFIDFQYISTFHDLDLSKLNGLYDYYDIASTKMNQKKHQVPSDFVSEYPSLSPACSYLPTLFPANVPTKYRKDC